MTRADVARQVGVGKPRITKAIKSGRIKTNPDGSLPDDAVEQWERNRKDVNPNAQKAKKSLAVTPENAPTFLAVKIRKETAAAQLKEIELAREKNQLLEKEAVKESIFKWARNIRDAVLTIPDRVASELSAQVAGIIASGKKTSEAEIERLVRNVWAKESRAALAAIDKTPNPKNKKRTNESSEET